MSDFRADQPDSVSVDSTDTIASQPNLVPPLPTPLFPAMQAAETTPVAARTSNSHIRTQPVPLALADICHGPSVLHLRKSIVDEVECGGHSFDVGFYIKTVPSSSRGANQLIITIHRRVKTRGVKRKRGGEYTCAPHSNGSLSGSQSSNSSKKRRLNDSNCLSYSAKAHSLATDSDDSIYDSDGPRRAQPQPQPTARVAVTFKVMLATPAARGLVHSQTHKCRFGPRPDAAQSIDADDGDTWDAAIDEHTNSDDNVCGFVVQTLQQLQAFYPHGSSGPTRDKVLKFEFEITVDTAAAAAVAVVTSAMASQSQYQRPIFSNRKVTRFVGLRNEGATCYMNSMLQTLYHLAALRRNVYKIPVGHEQRQKKQQQQQQQQEAAKKNSTQNVKSITNGIANGLDVQPTPNGQQMEEEEDGMMDSDDSEYEALKRKRQQSSLKPPISLELQRLFYQLQTGAESNHRDEYQIDQDANANDGNEDAMSDCSVFTLKSEAAADAVDDDDEDDDVDMTQQHPRKAKKQKQTEECSENTWISTYDKAVSTQKLIQSFGWGSADAFVQHDVQEFLRVLMDKIEAKVKATPAEKIVERLFGGEYESYISCVNADFQSVQKEKFQDIQLTIPKRARPARQRSRCGVANCRDASCAGYSSRGEDGHMPDIYDCFRKFIEPERMDGENQYFANEKLGKQDADKGLRFTKFPPVLFLHLCRFEIDMSSHSMYSRGNASKINDPVRFYQDIDLSPFVYVPPPPPPPQAAQEAAHPEGQGQDGDNKENHQQPPPPLGSDADNKYYTHLASAKHGGSGESGYQLFSVLVHSGGAYGGHYFAYLNPSGHSWYKFDDEHVTMVSAEEATTKQFGGNTRQSAYMLVYVQKRYARQVLREVQEQDIPRNLRLHFRKEKEEVIRKRAESIENEKKCAVLCMNAHELVVEDGIADGDAADSRVNLLDMQMRSCFATQFVYKDTTMKALVLEWLDNSGIAPDNLLLWNFTQRKNETTRPNRQIAIEWKETPTAADDEKYSADQIRRHMIPTDASKLKSVTSLYQRIGDLLEKKRAFMLLDRTRVAEFPVPAASSENSQKSQILIALKYFDIVHQRLYFVDWLLCNHSMCVQDIAAYIDETLVPSTRSRRSYFRELHALSQEMGAFGARHSHAFTKYAFFEEEKTTSNAKSFENEKNFKVNLLEYDACLTKENYMNGDILVFQLNSKHPYFKQRNEPERSGNLSGSDSDQPLQRSPTRSPQTKPLAWRLQAYQRVFEAQGEFWYPLVKQFIRSRLNLIRVKLTVRENAGWKSTWAPALLLQHQTRNEGVAIDKAERRRITRKTHTFRVEKDCTFGMLRTRLGAYYGIRATHIEIWTPSVTSYASNKLWDYGSTARGAWHETLRSLVERRLEYRQELPLKFEIQTYNVKEFDQMTELDHVRQSAPRAARFGERIRSLAMFNVKFLPPGFGGSGGPEVYDMTVAYRQNFVARQLIRWLFAEITANPIFGYTFCRPLLRYIQQEHEEQQGSGATATTADDVSWLAAIPAHRFLVCFIEAGKLEVPDTFHMDDQYVMPQHFAQTKYTDFRVQMLAADDPKVLRYEMKQQQQQQQPPKEGSMEVELVDSRSQNGHGTIAEADGDEKSMPNADAEAEIPTKAVWCHFVKQQETTQSKACVRTVLHKGESLKQLILAQLLQYLKVSLTPSSSTTNLLSSSSSAQSAAADTDTNKATATPASESDALFDAICERYKFRLYASNLPKKWQVLSLGLLQATDIFEQLNVHETFFLAVTLPKPKQKINYHNRALTIND